MKSFEMHRVGWLLALAVVGQFPYRLFALIWLKKARQVHLQSTSSVITLPQKQVLSVETIPTNVTEERNLIEVEVLSELVRENPESLP